MKKNKKVEIKNRLNKEIKIMIASLIGLSLIAIAFFWFTQINTPVPPESVVPENLTREFNHKIGPDSAKVKIVEFYDPECEACSAFYPYVKETIKRYEKDVQLTVRYALYHGNSLLAAKASDAAALQGKFWNFQELLFLNQHEWSHKNESSISFFVKYAQDLELDISKFKADIEDPSRIESINIDIEDGKKLGVNGTPTIFVNGKKLLNISPSSFQELVELELKK